MIYDKRTTIKLYSDTGDYCILYDISTNKRSLLHFSNSMYIPKCNIEESLSDLIAAGWKIVE